MQELVQPKQESASQVFLERRCEHSHTCEACVLGPVLAAAGFIYAGQCPGGSVFSFLSEAEETWRS